MQTPRPSVSGLELSSTCSISGALALPDILEMIFKLLKTSDKGRVAQVCVIWRNVCYSQSLWRHVVAELCLTELDPVMLASLGKRGIMHVRVMNSRALAMVVQGLPQLQSIYLGDSSNSCNFTNWNLFRSFSVKLPQLTTLNLDYCNDLTDNFIFLISQNFAKLSTLSLNSCSNLTDAALRHISIGFPNLNRLVLQSCELITNEGVFCISDGNQMLTHLNLSFCVNVTSSGLKALCIGLHNLNSLDLNNCSGIKQEGIKYLSELKQLRTLRLRSCCVFDEGLAHLGNGKSATTIAYLEIGENGDITSSGMNHLTKLTNLSHLDLQSCTGICDIGLANLLVAKLHLTNLNLSSCENLTDSGFALLAAIVHLRKLNLSFCNISDQGLASLIIGGSAVAILDLRGCQLVTDAGLESLANLTNLQLLVLRGYHGITGSGLFKLKECLDNSGMMLRIYEKVLL